MSLSLYNHDGTWFKVDSPDVAIDTIMSHDVISLNITERMAEMDRGSVTLLDRNNIYSRLLRPGARLFVSWGIRLNSKDSLARNAIEFMINSPSGGGDGNGVITYQCSFMALGFRGTQSNKWYETGTKTDVIAEVMQRIGIIPSDYEINFARGKESISNGQKVCQYESDFRFLVRMADEWHAAFRIGQDMKGNKIACFVDYSRLNSTLFVRKLTEASAVHLEYGAFRSDYRFSSFTGKSNVLSYTWEDHSMDASAGQGFRIVEIDGKPQVFSYTVQDEKVTTWRLVPELIERELGVHDLSGKTELLKEYLSATSFEQIKRFFVEETTTTAPQGSGVTVKSKVMGDPTITAGLVATFGFGFPSRVGSSDRTWWIRETQHEISNAGYFCDLEIADAYAFNPTGQMITPVGGTS